MEYSPFFSIVIPTRNRHFCLPNALQSCLNQEFEDFEVVLSNNNSSDSTAKIGQEFLSKYEKLRYYNTHSDLSVSNSFEFALKHAAGKYVLFCCDDEVLKPTTLKKLYDIIQKTETEVVSYGRNLIFIKMQISGSSHSAFYLNVGPFTKEISIHRTNELLRILFDNCSIMGEKYYYRAFPLTGKAAISRDLINRVISKHGRFHFEEPMWSSMVLTLAATDSLVLCDEHFLMSYDVGEFLGRGSQFQNKRTYFDDADQTIDTKTSEELFNLPKLITPIKIITLRNVMVNAILKAQKLCSPAFDELQLNYKNYIYALLREVYQLSSHGVDVEEDIKEIFDFMKVNHIKDGYSYRFDKYRFFKPQFIFYTLGKKLSNHLEKLDKHKSAWQRNLSGDEYGFQNVIECVNKFDSIATHFEGNRYPHRLHRKFYPNSQLV